MPPSPAELENYPWWTAPKEGHFHAVEIGDVYRPNGKVPGGGAIGCVLNLENKYAAEREANSLARKGEEMHVFHDGRVRYIPADGKVFEYKVEMLRPRPPLNAPTERAQEFSR